MSEFIWALPAAGHRPRTTLHTTTTGDRQSKSTDRAVTHLKAMATVATLLEFVDMARLIATRDRISVGRTMADLDIPSQAAYREYVR